MAMRVTRRRCEVTSLWAALLSACSCQRLASMNSSSGSSIGNLRISSRYRTSPPESAAIVGSFAIISPSNRRLHDGASCSNRSPPDRLHYNNVWVAWLLTLLHDHRTLLCNLGNG